MKAKKGFNLREVCGEQIVVPEGVENIDFSNIISMNETAAYLWAEVQGKEFDAELLADLLTQAYEVDYEQALADSTQLINEWIKAEIVEE